MDARIERHLQLQVENRLRELRAIRDRAYRFSGVLSAAQDAEEADRQIRRIETGEQ